MDEDIAKYRPGAYTGDSIVNKYTSTNPAENSNDKESKVNNGETTTSSKLRTFSETLKMLDDDVTADLNVK